MSETISIVILILIVLLYYKVAIIEANLRKQTDLNRKIDVLLKHFDLKWGSLTDTPEEILDYLNQDKTIAAIKAYRKYYGVGLKEASEKIERLIVQLKEKHEQSTK